MSALRYVFGGFVGAMCSYGLISLFTKPSLITTISVCVAGAFLGVVYKAFSVPPPKYFTPDDVVPKGLVDLYSNPIRPTITLLGE